jgi:hypothetical protein
MGDLTNLVAVECERTNSNETNDVTMKVVEIDHPPTCGNLELHFCAIMLDVCG